VLARHQKTPNQVGEKSTKPTSEKTAEKDIEDKATESTSEETLEKDIGEVTRDLVFLAGQANNSTNITCIVGVFDFKQRGEEEGVFTV